MYWTLEGMGGLESLLPFYSAERQKIGIRRGGCRGSKHPSAASELVIGAATRLPTLSCSAHFLRDSRPPVITEATCKNREERPCRCGNMKKDNIFELGAVAAKSQEGPNRQNWQREVEPQLTRQ